MVNIPTLPIKSADGVQNMPVIGLGTATAGASDHDVVVTAILEAIKIGYRHFDTASLYGSEAPIGKAIAEALRLRFIKSRDELFITTKLWCDSTERHLVLPALQNSLKNLGLEYVELYLIHVPAKLNVPFRPPLPADSLTPMDIKAVWEAMEECQNLGLAKSIGVSNFSPNKLQEILSSCKSHPAVNQVEMNPTWQNKKLVEFCKKNDIVVTAYRPLGSAVWSNKTDVLEEIAKAHGKTTAQISLRWLYEQGVVVVPKSYNKERMKQNLEIFDFSLTEEDLKKISQLPQKKGFAIGPMMLGPNPIVAEIDTET